MNAVSSLSPAGKKSHAPLQLRTAYAVCRSIARSAAKNFYYSFLVLPRAKRDGLCAVYAFMRRADDIADSDTPELTVGQKRLALESWIEGLHRVVEGGLTDDPVLMALGETQRRFKIPMEWLDQLVQGVAMDVQEHIPVKVVPRPIAAPPPAVLYEKFADLYLYCYRVASVVGLISIRIFGYQDSAAELLAEQCGVALQLTNIIRDVKEDALMGRVYLPREDLDKFGRSEMELMEGFDAERFRPLLESEAQRAREFYSAAEKLIPMVDEDSRPALWALVEIYRRLLEKIAANQYNVFGGKIRLTRAEKLAVLSKGLWRRLV